VISDTLVGRMTTPDTKAIRPFGIHCTPLTQISPERFDMVAQRDNSEA
jgi:hypothetical protein